MDSSSSSSLPIADKHNLVAYLLKPKEAEGYFEIIDFLKRSNLREALTINPIIYISHLNDFWTSAKKTEVNKVPTILGKVAGQVIKVSEASIRAHLLLHDEDGMECFPLAQIFDQLMLLGYEGGRDNKLTFFKSMFSSQWKYLIHTLQQCISQKKTSFDQFSSNIASAIICLANNLKFNFSKMIFNGMLYNLDHPKDKFLMYPRFLQHLFNKELNNLPVDGGKLVLSSHSKKIFANMRRTGSLKGIAFSGRVTNLTTHMTSAPSTAEVGPSSTSAPVAQEEITPPSSQPIAAGSLPKKTRDPKPSKSKAQRAKKQTSETPLSQMSQPNFFEYEVVDEEERDHMGRATTTATTSEGVQDSGNILRTQPMATQNIEIPLDSSTAEDPVDINIFSGPRCQETLLGANDAQTRSETLAKSSNDPLKEGNTSGNGEDSSLLQELTDTCTHLCKAVQRLEKGMKEQELEIQKLKGLVKRLMKERRVGKDKAKSKSAGLKRLLKAGRAQVIMSTSSSSSSSDNDDNDENPFEFTGAGLHTTEEMNVDEMADIDQSEGANLFVYESEKDTNEDVIAERTNLGSGLFEDVPSELFESSATPVIIANEELIAAEALIKVAKTPTPPKTVTPRGLGISINEPVSGKKPEAVQEDLKEKTKAMDKGKGIMVEPEKPMKRKDLEALSEREARRIQDEWNAGIYDEPESLIEVDMGAGVKIKMTKDEQVHFDEIMAQQEYESQWSELSPIQRQEQLELLLNQKRTHEAEQKQAKLKAKPKTKAQMKDLYARGLRGSTGLSLTALKKWDFETLKSRYEAEQKFYPMSDESETSKEKKKNDEGLITFVRKRKRSNLGAYTEMKKHQKVVEAEKEEEVHTDVPSTDENDDEKEIDDGLDMNRLRQMVEIDTTKYIPLAVEYPIIDWFMYTDINMKKTFKVVRVGDKAEYYNSFWSMVSIFNRNELNQMWDIGKKKYATAERHSDNRVLYDQLALMFEPNASMEYFSQIFSDIYSWYLFAHNGVHVVIHKNGTSGFFLADQFYPFHIRMLKQMVKFKVKCRDVDLAAYLVNEMEKLLDKCIEESKKHEADILRRASPSIREKILKSLKKT